MISPDRAIVDHDHDQNQIHLERRQFHSKATDSIPVQGPATGQDQSIRFLGSSVYPLMVSFFGQDDPAIMIMIFMIQGAKGPYLTNYEPLPATKQKSL